MQQQFLPVNEIEPLINVRLVNAALLRAKARPGHLPGIVAVFGHAGYGKTCAATLVANTHDCAYVEIKNYWNRKAFFRAMCEEVGVPCLSMSIAEMGRAISTQLGRMRRPLIIDEADLAVKKDWIEDIRGIFEDSRSAIILIGEEALPQKLMRWEKFHSRVLEWVPAEPPALEETAALAKKFSRGGIAMADDLIMELHTQSTQSLRRVCTNIERVLELAQENGLETVTFADWKASGKTFYTGDVSRATAAGVPQRGRR